MKQHNIKLFQQFNTSDTTLVISGYPEKGRNGKSHGIAWYTQKYLVPLAEKYHQRFVVLAEKSHYNKPTTYANGKILVLRIFDNDQIHLYPQILTWLSVFSNITNIHVHSEFGMKAGTWHFGMVIPFLTLIKLTGKKITFYSHNVIENIGVLAGHLNIKPNSIIAKAINATLRVYYALLSGISDEIVVLDTAIADKLAKFVPANKIKTSTIAIDTKKPSMTQIQAKKKLGIAKNKKVILYFGFVSWYKGADWLINTFNSLSQAGKTGDTHLIIAGGQSYSLAQKAYYQKYYFDLENTVRTNNNMTLTGFVREKDLDLYYAAADLVVLPYRGLMGASGCLSHALAYGKPVMVSSKMKALFKDNQIKQALQSVDGLTQQLLTFGHSKSGLQKITTNLNSKQTTKNLKQFSKKVAALRSPAVTAARDYNILTQSQHSGLVTQLSSWLQRLAPQRLIGYTKLWSKS